MGLQQRIIECDTEIDNARDMLQASCNGEDRDMYLKRIQRYQEIRRRMLIDMNRIF